MRLRRRAARGLVSGGIIAAGGCAVLLWQGASAGIFAPGLLLGVGAAALGALSLDPGDGGTGSGGDGSSNEAGDAGSGDAGGGESGGDGSGGK